MSKKYSLYVARGEYRAYEREAFYDPNKDYTLLFTHEPPEGFIEVPEGTMGALSPAERRWLTECKLAVNLEVMKQQSAAITELMEAFIAAFEAELKKGKEDIENEQSC